MRRPIGRHGCIRLGRQAIETPPIERSRGVDRPLETPGEQKPLKHVSVLCHRAAGLGHLTVIPAGAAIERQRVFGALERRIGSPTAKRICDAR
jgi:hypothetical protein